MKDINVVGKQITRNGRKMRITIVTTRLGESVFICLGILKDFSGMCNMENSIVIVLTYNLHITCSRDPNHENNWS